MSAPDRRSQAVPHSGTQFRIVEQDGSRTRRRPRAAAGPVPARRGRRRARARRAPEPWRGPPRAPADQRRRGARPVRRHPPSGRGRRPVVHGHRGGDRAHAIHGPPADPGAGGPRVPRVGRRLRLRPRPPPAGARHQRGAGPAAPRARAPGARTPRALDRRERAALRPRRRSPCLHRRRRVRERAPHDRRDRRVAPAHEGLGRDGLPRVGRRTTTGRGSSTPPRIRSGSSGSS